MYSTMYDKKLFFFFIIHNSPPKLLGKHYRKSLSSKENEPFEELNNYKDQQYSPTLQCGINSLALDVTGR